ncbi:SirB2 family protein [Pseudomonas sp. HK3]|jgi:uncharacterized membrane protein SirB2
MALESLYAPLKHTHLLLVSISIFYFALRGGSKLLKKQWQDKLAVRISAYTIDSFLLLTGVLLMFATSQYPIAQSWLTVKLIVLVGYIVFGIKAMKSNTQVIQSGYLAAAIACVLLMITIARTHHPLGLFSLM